MIWMSLRQFRAQAVVGVVAGTHQLVWNQSVTRRRWLLVKLLVVVGGGMVAAGMVSLLLTWGASPVDAVADARFSTVVFGARNIAPVAYAAFAVVIGAIGGLLARRTLPAMAMTVLVILAVQFAVPNLVRPHLRPPVTIDRAMTEDAINEARGLGSITNGATVKGLTIPDAWVTDVSDLRTHDGRTLDGRTFNERLSAPNEPDVPATGRFGAAARCLGNLNLHVRIAYQPHQRYWPFQFLESGLYLILAGLLTLSASGGSSAGPADRQGSRTTATSRSDTGPTRASGCERRPAPRPGPDDAPGSESGICHDTHPPRYRAHLSADRDLAASAARSR